LIGVAKFLEPHRDHTEYAARNLRTVLVNKA
jgi:hypothetical protein